MVEIMGRDLQHHHKGIRYEMGGIYYGSLNRLALRKHNYVFFGT